jgi:hypothetical protein
MSRPSGHLPSAMLTPLAAVVATLGGTRDAWRRIRRRSPRAWRRPGRHRAGALIAAIAVALLGVPRARAVELDTVFGKAAAKPPLAARDVLDRAMRQLFGAPSLMVVTAQRMRDGEEPSISQFRVLRHQVEDSTRIMIESLAPTSIRGTRILQIQEGSGAISSFLSVRSTDGERVQTNLRLADPFLCTWYEIPEGERLSPAAAMVDEELLAHIVEDVDGERIHRIMTRPLASRGYDRVEYAISERDFAILQYIHYLRREDVQPTLIARVERQNLVELDGRMLPRVLEYEDRTDGSRIIATLEHMQMPSDIPESLFQPRAFHRLGLDTYFAPGQ